MAESFHIAIVSGKLGGVDGVSLEVDKWIAALTELGHTISTIAGVYAQPLASVPKERQHTVPEFRFDSEYQRDVEMQVFPYMSRHALHPSGAELSALREKLETRGRELGVVLHDIVKDHGIDVLVGENTNAMPMTILGGIAVHYVATQQRVATIFHHHDFWWERSRFSNSRIEALLNRIMPPVDLGLEHVVISSYAAHILASLKRVQPRIVPNCEDFEHTVDRDEYNETFRADFGFAEDDILVVQPTRIVPRKRIEDAIALTGRFCERFPDLAPRVHYIISLYQGDEPDEDYVDLIKRTAERWSVRLHIISDRVRSVRGTDEHGNKLYTNRDVLAHADLVTFLPIWEGFGNALLEAIAARVPIVTTTYLVYKTDIMPTGLRTIEVRDRYAAHGELVVDDAVLDAMRAVVTTPELREEIVEHNFATARREFGMDRLKELLAELLVDYGDEIRASRKRIAKSKQRYSV